MKSLMSIIIFSFTIALGCQQLDIMNYRGDGTIEAHKGEGPVGFRIVFAQFPLYQNYEGEYRISGLPQTEQLYSFQLETDGNSDDFVTNKSLLKMQLQDKEGNTIFSCSETLDNWISSSSSGTSIKTYYMHEVGGRKCSTLLNPKEIDIKQDMILTVQYTSNGLADKKDGIVVLESGGYY